MGNRFKKPFENLFRGTPKLKSEKALFGEFRHQMN